MNASQLIEKLNSRRCLIYGTGYVAHRFYSALVKRGLESAVEAFVTTTGSDELFFGLPVLSVREISSPDSFVCIAVHEAIKDDIIDTLLSRQIDEYEWIYPLLYDLILGDPVKVSVEVSLKDILLACSDEYTIESRALAIDQYYGKCDNGYDIYKRMLSLHATPETAERRVISLIELIRAWEKNGYLKEYPVKLYDNSGWIEGTHRIALACHYDMQTIYADLYRYDDEMPAHDKQAVCTEAELRSCGIEDSVISILKDKKRELFLRYGLE